MSFDHVRYANCWEDADILCEAIVPRAGARMLSVASAGDNVLALLAAGAEVVAADLSPAQLACLELRCAAFQELDYLSLLAFLGVHPCSQRLSTFRQLQQNLSPATREFWSRRPGDIANGVIHAGRLENYFRLFRRRVLPLIHSRRIVSALLQQRTRPERAQFYEHVWNNRRWRVLFHLFFSRVMLGRVARDPEFFRFVEGSVADRVLDRTRFALIDLPTDSNPWLEYIATGNFGNSLPKYLLPENYQPVRDGLPRLSICPGSIDQAGAIHRKAGFDGFNLSDIFEYLDPAESEALYGRLLSLARPAARLAYWNTFVPRRRPDQFVDQVTELSELSRHLFQRDRAFFYQDFHVDEVRRPL